MICRERRTVSDGPKIHISSRFVTHQYYVSQNGNSHVPFDIQNCAHHLRINTDDSWITRGVNAENYRRKDETLSGKPAAYWMYSSNGFQFDEYLF